MQSIFLHSASAPTAKASTIETAIPNAKRPLWAKAMALLKSTSDRGVGDTVERTIGKSNSAAFKAWYLATFKKSCGCGERKNECISKYNYADNQR